MGEPGGEVCSLLCGGCCLVCFSGFASWSNTRSYGSGGCCCGRNGVAGCCGSCCNDSFDEDKFDQQVKKDLERTRDPNAPPVAAAAANKNLNTQQMQPSTGMSTQPQGSQLTVEKVREE